MQNFPTFQSIFPTMISLILATLLGTALALTLLGEKDFRGPKVEIDRLRLGREALVTVLAASTLHVTGFFINHGYYCQEIAAAQRFSSWEAPQEEHMADFGVEEFRNEGVFLYDYLGAQKAPSFAIRGRVFSNMGIMWIRTDGQTQEKHAGSPDQTSVVIVTEGQLENIGRMLISGSPEYPAWVSLKGSAAETPALVNKGALCFQHSFYNQISNIGGNGCLVIGRDAELTIDSKFDFDLEQQIFMHTAKGTTTLNLEFSETSKEVHLRVHGFSKGASIRFSEPMEKFSYEDGVLKLSRPKVGFTHFLHIGEGYSKRRFKFHKTSITYSEDMRPPFPPECRCNWAFGLLHG